MVVLRKLQVPAWKIHAIPAYACWLHESGNCLTYTFGVRETWPIVSEARDAQ